MPTDVYTDIHTTKEKLIDFIRQINGGRGVISDDYIGRIAEAIVKDVAEDIFECADVDWNEDDVRLAVGRSLCKKLGLDY